MADVAHRRRTVNGGAPHGRAFGPCASRPLPTTRSPCAPAARATSRPTTRASACSPCAATRTPTSTSSTTSSAITDRIWEDQDVGYIYDTYRAGCRVYDDGGPKYGVERVVEGTMQSIHAFPDSRHYADDIIWAGNEDEGFATSHRAINVGHHLGPWRWGEPTRQQDLPVGDRQLRLRGEPDLRGVGALQRRRAPAPVRHRRPRRGAPATATSGREPAARRARADGDRAPRRAAATRSAIPSRRHGFDVEHFVRALFHDTYNRRDLSAIDRAYAPNVRWHGGVAARGLRPRRRAQDGPRPDGDVPGPRPARGRGLLDGQRGRGLQRLGALDRDRHPPRVRPLRRADGPPRAPLGAQPALHPRRRASPRSGRCSTSSTCWRSCYGE